MNRPDFSPAMLRTFLHLRSDLAVSQDADAAGASRAARRAVNRFRAAMRERAGVSIAEFNQAWRGTRTLAVEPRRRLWRAMDLDPADAGIRLIENGGQERA